MLAIVLTADHIVW